MNNTNHGTRKEVNRKYVNDSGLQQITTKVHVDHREMNNGLKPFKCTKWEVYA